jgi:chromosome segregation ATPase
VKAGLAVPRPSVAAGFSRPDDAGRLKAVPTPAADDDKALRTEARKHAKRIKKIDEEIAALEARIAAAERERERNDFLLCSEEVYRDGERTKKIQAQNADLKAMIELLYGKWEALAREKEELEGAVA